MFDAYKVGVTLALTDKVSGGLLLMTSKLGLAEAGVTKLQKKLDDTRKAGKMAAYELTAAFAIASPFVLAISDAARLQKEMIGIQQATGATTKQIDSMRVAIEKSAGQTMFSIIDVAKMAKTVGTGTTLTPDQVTALLPEYAKFADVQLLLKGTPAQQSVKEAVRLAHTAGHYDPESLRQYLDLLNDLSMVIPGGLGEAGHALKYSQSVAKNALGMSDKDTIEMVALLNQLGFSGSRGGTNFIAAATRSIPGIFGSGLLKGKSNTALHEMGMSDSAGHATFFRDGKFDTHLWMQGMAKFVAATFQKMPEAEARQYILKHFQDSLGTNGQRIADLLATPQALAQLLAIEEKFGRLPSVDATQGVFADRSVVQGFENAKTNFTSLLTEMGYPLLPDAEKALKGVNGSLTELIQKAHDNPGAVRTLTYSFGGLATALGFAGTVNLLKFAFGGLGGSLLVLPAVIAGITGAIAALVGKENVSKIGEATDWLGGKYNPLSLIHDTASWATNAFRWDGSTREQSIAPPPKANSGTYNNPTILMVDGRVLGQISNNYSSLSAGTATANSFSGVDYHMIPVQAGGSW